MEKYQHYCAEHKFSAEIRHLIPVTYPCLKRHSKMIRMARGQSMLQEKPPRIGRADENEVRTQQHMH